jgi:hypothetical protein
MKRLRLIAPLLLSGLLLGGPAAATTAELEPSRGPSTQGPVTLDDSACTEREIKGDDGLLLGRAEACVFVYSFDTLRELDLQREYGAIWTQARFTPEPGWCSTELSVGLQMDGGTPEKTTKAPAKRKALTRLVLNAHGNALEAAQISQSWAHFGKTTNEVVKGDKVELSSRWKGKTDRSVSMVSGLAYSYNVLDGPPEGFAYGFDRFSLAAC